MTQEEIEVLINNIDRKLDSLIYIMLDNTNKINHIESLLMIEDKTQNAREVMNNMIADYLMKLKEGSL